MKKWKVVLTAALVMFLAAGPGLAGNEEGVFDGAQFPEWLEAEGIWRTTPAGQFVDDEAYKPTEEDIETMMNMATMAPTSMGLNDILWVVLTDTEAQKDFLGDEHVTDSTILALVFGDRLYPEDESAGGHAQSLSRGYYNPGISTGYLNLAAISLGYSTRMYMTTKYANADPPRPISAEEHILKDSGYEYVLGSAHPERGEKGDTIEAWGNLKFVGGVLIGTLDEEAETTVTQSIYKENWVIHDE